MRTRCFENSVHLTQPLLLHVYVQWHTAHDLSQTKRIQAYISFIRAHLHQRGAGPPAGAGSVFCASRVFTLARVCAQFHFTGAPFRGTGSLIYKYRTISAPYFCGSRRRIVPWAISAGARRGPAAEAERARGGVNSTTQLLQTDPLRNPRAGSARAPRAFSALV